MFEVDTDKKEVWCFTFGQNHRTEEGKSLGDKFVRIEGDINSTREVMFELRGAKWSMQYHMADFKSECPINLWKITEVELEDIRLSK